MHGVFKLSHAVDFEPILLRNLSTYFLLDTGKLILLLLEANIEKMETPTVIFFTKEDDKKLEILPSELNRKHPFPPPIIVTSILNEALKKTYECIGARFRFFPTCTGSGSG